MSESRQSIFGSTNTQKINIHATQVLTKPERLPGSPLLSTKKGIIFDGPFFCGEQGRKMRSIFFFYPHPYLPRGGRLGRFVPKLRKGLAVRGVFFYSGGGGFWGTFWVRCCGRPLAGASRLGDVCCLYLCGCNGSDLRDLVPLRRCVSDVGRSVVFVCWIVSPWPCRSGSVLRDLMPLRRLVRRVRVIVRG